MGAGLFAFLFLSRFDFSIYLTNPEVDLLIAAPPAHIIGALATQFIERHALNPGQPILFFQWAFFFGMVHGSVRRR